MGASAAGGSVRPSRPDIPVPRAKKLKAMVTGEATKPGQPLGHPIVLSDSECDDASQLSMSDDEDIEDGRQTNVIVEAHRIVISKQFSVNHVMCAVNVTSGQLQLARGGVRYQLDPADIHSIEVRM